MPEQSLRRMGCPASMPSNTKIPNGFAQGIANRHVRLAYEIEARLTCHFGVNDQPVSQHSLMAEDLSRVPVLLDTRRTSAPELAIKSPILLKELSIKRGEGVKHNVLTLDVRRGKCAVKRKRRVLKSSASRTLCTFGKVDS